MPKRRINRREQSSADEVKEKETRLGVDVTKHLKQTVAFAVALYCIVPIVLILVPQVGQQVLYMNLYVGRNEVKSLKSPGTDYSLPGTAVFHIPCDEFQIGMWHVLPENRLSHYASDGIISVDLVSEELHKAKSIIIYHHGAGSTRATGDYYQRAKLYKVLQAEGYHVIAFDYRGYGDSTGWPTEQGLINDSLCVHKWVKDRTNSQAKIYFWGHSMGGSIATQAAKKLYDRYDCDVSTEICSNKIDGLVVEGSPATARKAAKFNPIIRVAMKIYPEALLNKAIEGSLGETYLATERDLPMVQCPVLLLYAEDDSTIPSSHGDILFSVCKEKMKHDNKRVKLVKFKAAYGYGHENIYKATELPELVHKFIGHEGNELDFETIVL